MVMNYDLVSCRFGWSWVRDIENACATARAKSQKARLPSQCMDSRINLRNDG